MRRRLPGYPRKRYDYWGLPDPAGASLDEVRAFATRSTGVQALLAELSPVTTG